MADDGVQQEYWYKILVVGEIGAGKTSIIKRFVHNIFSSHYKSTIGVDFALKVIHWDDKTEVRLQLWDIAGQERFGNMTRVYYKEAVGAFVVFDVTRHSTFDAVAQWKSDIDAKVTWGPNNEPIPVVLLANKCDLGKESFDKTDQEMDEYAQQHGFIGWFETSAKENKGIDEAARALVQYILEHEDKRPVQADPSIIRADDPAPEPKSDGDSGCSC